MGKENFLEERVRCNRLYDLYGALLTDKQRRAYEMHEWEDWSLTEIAAHLDVSKQGVHDLISRSKEKLLYLESLLGIEQKMSIREDFYKEIKDLVNAYKRGLPPGFLKSLKELMEKR